MYANIYIYIYIVVPGRRRCPRGHLAPPDSWPSYRISIYIYVCIYVCLFIYKPYRAEDGVLVDTLLRQTLGQVVVYLYTYIYICIYIYMYIWGRTGQKTVSS